MNYYMYIIIIADVRVFAYHICTVKKTILPRCHIILIAEFSNRTAIIGDIIKYFLTLLIYKYRHKCSHIYLHLYDYLSSNKMS